MDQHKKLGKFDHKWLYDAVLIDGPHGYPFPEFEYMCFYPHIREGGLLIIDDIQIPTSGRTVDVLQEDAMWRTLWSDAKTVIFERANAPATPATGDHWWTQAYNRRRTHNPKFRLEDGGMMPPTEGAVSAKFNQMKKTERPSALKKLLKGKPRAAWRIWRSGN